jgi:hypothetical protein
VKEWTPEDMRRTITEFAGMEWTAWNEAFWTPERIRSCQDWFEQDFAADIERWERQDRHWWPLAYFQKNGIKIGVQESTLTALAARYARDFTVGQLADELWKVIEASEQDPKNSKGLWKRGQMYAKAARAHEFIEREAAREATWMPGLMVWCERANAEAASLPRNRQPRKPRKPGAR